MNAALIKRSARRLQSPKASVNYCAQSTEVLKQNALCNATKMRIDEQKSWTYFKT